MITIGLIQIAAAVAPTILALAPATTGLAPLFLLGLR